MAAASTTKCRHCGGTTTAGWESRWALCSLCNRFTHKVDLERRIPDPVYLRCHNCGEGEFCKCSAVSDAAYLQLLVRMGGTV